jgi:hypothetical protein
LWKGEADEGERERERGEERVEWYGVRKEVKAVRRAHHVVRARG